MQRNETIKNLFPGYYRKYDQDMETLADLTKRAKGDERSINEFARVCGVSPSTISRLINKKNTTPNKDSLIKAIADNAVPESGVTLDMLLQAHGLEKINVYEGKERKSESVLEDIVIDRLLCDITQLGCKCEIEKKIEYFKQGGMGKLFRGKFEIEFLKKIIDSLKAKNKTGGYFSSKYTSVHIDPNINILSALADYADTPQCLIDFLKQYQVA